MKTLFFDSLGGASGDMVLASLIDLGADLHQIRIALKHMINDSFSILTEEVLEGGLRGKRLKIAVAHHGHNHHHRNLADIEKLIRSGRLPPAVQQNTIQVFQRLAKAEAKIHGVSLQKIHFHEVGALDSIIDIVGSCIALGQIGAEKVAVGSLPIGCGTINCAHGILPSPAPATLELLKGFAVEQTREKFELVTPTGAALLTAWKNIELVPAGSKIIGTGHGIGNFKLAERPNLLRATLFETRQASTSESCLVLECNIDDMSPELTGHLVGRLMEEGALDAFIIPVQMKKNRPGALLSVICGHALKSKMLDLIFSESSTFGVREYEVRRTTLSRRFETVKTPYGKVRIKMGSWNGREMSRAPEFEDCRKLAEKSNVPLRKIYETAMAAAGRKAGIS